jgi:hypothetical protein
VWPASLCLIEIRMIWCGDQARCPRTGAASTSRLASGCATVEYRHVLSSNDVTGEMETAHA